MNLTHTLHVPKYSGRDPQLSKLLRVEVQRSPPHKWLAVIPQLCARVGHPDPFVQDLVRLQ